ncbi:MAG: hypothetical protein ABID40_03470 [Candidatus Bipolaricaulota bacterium]
MTRVTGRRDAGEVLAPIGIEVVGTVEVHGAPDADAEARAAALAEELTARVRACRPPGART